MRNTSVPMDDQKGCADVTFVCHVAVLLFLVAPLIEWWSHSD